MEVVRQTLKPHVPGGPGGEAAVAIADALRGRFVVAVRKPKPLADTPRALSMRLPDVGVEIAVERDERHYTVRVVGEREVECEVGGKVSRYRTLKAVAKAILGYAPSVSGWVFFFGMMERDEVTRMYGKAKQ